jgi:SAM-dependent methyltransferase
MEWLRTIRQVRYAAAVELSPIAANSACRIFDDVEATDVSCAQFRFQTNQFDLIIALDVLEHLADPWSVLKRLRELLAPDGVLIVSIPNVAHYRVSWRLFFLGEWEYRDEGLLDRTHLRFFTRKTAVELLTSSGFLVTAVGRNVEFPHIFNMLGISGRRWRWYGQRLMRMLIPWPGRFFTVQFLLSARRAVSNDTNER